MLLSIIIPVYNAEKFIKRCVESIIEQLYLLNSIELIIINDGSSDQSSQILEKLNIKYDLIRLYNQKNLGEGFTRNVGLEKSKGDFIWFIDADDYIDGNILIHIYNILLDKSPEIIQFGYKTVNSKGIKISEKKFEDKILTTQSLVLNSQYTNTVWSKVIKKRLIEKNKIRFNSNVKTATDFDFSFKVLYFSEEVVTIDNTGYNYVIHPDSISNMRTETHLKRLAKDSVIIGNGIYIYMNKIINDERNAIFKIWLDNYLYGLLLSLFRFNYKSKFIANILKELRTANNYPVNNDKLEFKKKLFLLLANNETIFLVVCRFKRLFN